MTTARDITIYQGQEFTLSLDYAGATGRAQVMHIRLADSTATVVQILTHNGAANSRVIYNDATQKLDITIGATVSDAWVVLADRVEWVFDIKDYEPGSEDGAVIPYRGKVILRGTRTRPSDVTPSPQMPSGDGRYTRFDGEQNLTPEQMAQAQINILGEEYSPGAGSGDVVGPAGATDGRISEFDGTTGKLLRQSSYTIATLIAYVVARAQHTGTQLAATISDFASAAIAAVTWSTITGKPSTFDPSAHKANHATGGSDALTAADIGAAAAGHDHTGTYQPLATVLTNTTAAFTTAQETKLGAIEALADVTDAGNVGAAIDGATAKTTPVDADTVALIDSAAGNVLKKLSWANIKATLKTYFDAIYVTIGGALGTPSSGTLTNCTGYPAASTSASGIVELAIASEVDTGTDATRAMTPDSYRDSTPYNIDRTADWTLAQSDANTEQQFNSGSARVCTIDTNANVAISTQTVVPFLRLGSGSATIDAVAGVTLNGVDGASKVISTQYQGALLRKVGTNAWVISGDIA